MFSPKSHFSRIAGVVICVVVCLVLEVPVEAEPRTPLTLEAARKNLLDAPGAFAEALNQSVVDDIPRPASMFATGDLDTVPSPGILVGITSLDIQHNYAQGHQVAHKPGGNVVHFAWTMWDVVPLDEIFTRFAQYNGWDKTTSSLTCGVNGVSISLGDFARGGFVRIDVDDANLCNAVLEQRVEAGFPYSVWFDRFPIEGSALHLDSELDNPSAVNPDEVDNLWPDVAVEQRNGAGESNIYHYIGTSSLDLGGGLAVPSDHIWYWRGIASEMWGTAIWEGPVLLDSSSTLSYTIDAADDSGKVAVVYTSSYSTDNLNGRNNVVYRESHTSGLGWLDGSELGDIHKNFVTAYSNTAGPQAWVETSTAYDHSGNLHIIFLEQRADNSEQMSLRHWSNETGVVHTIVNAWYNNPNTWMHAANLAQISLGIGDGSTTCGGYSNQDYLYALYTKLGGKTPEEQADVSQLGFANGELYLSASWDGGSHWSTPINLTNTKTPNCTSQHPDSLCASEAWGTIARDVSDIEILYIRDFEAGYFGESGWTLNDVMYLNYPGGTLDAEYLCPPCTCPCHGDPICDGVVNVLDVVQAIFEVLRWDCIDDCPQDPGCPMRMIDVNCDDIANILDVVLFVNVAFRGGDPATEFCDPCAP